MSHLSVLWPSHETTRENQTGCSQRARLSHRHLSSKLQDSRCHHRPNPRSPRRRRLVLLQDRSLRRLPQKLHRQNLPLRKTSTNTRSMEASPRWAGVEAGRPSKSLSITPQPSSIGSHLAKPSENGAETTTSITRLSIFGWRRIKILLNGSRMHAILDTMRSPKRQWRSSTRSRWK